jgi:ABC-type multidrug transport system ATPase subunit
VKLSGGQRQRLSLARAFLTEPVILLLDEPTASVEPESESLIHDSILKRTREGAGTTLLVTHRIDLLRQGPRGFCFWRRGDSPAMGRTKNWWRVVRGMWMRITGGRWRRWRGGFRGGRTFRPW